jgi:hypothetical protein
LIKWFLSLLLLMCCFTFNDLCMSNHPCIPGMKSTWSRYMMFLICCWIQFANILLRIFALKVIKEIVILFFCCVLVWFWNECNTGFIEWV